MVSQSDPGLQELQAPHVVSTLKTCARGLALIAVLIGGLGLLGWMFGIPVFRSVRSGRATMDANTALAFVLSGLSLWLRCAEPTPTRRRLADICASAVLLIALLTFLQYALQRDFGIDRLLFLSIARSPGTPSPSQMAPVTASFFIITSIALLLLDVEDHRGHRPAQWLVFLVGPSALAALIGYLFVVLSPPRYIPDVSMTWHTALTFLLLAVGLLCARPDRGGMQIVTADAAGGAVARRLLPAAVMVPILLCMLIYLGYDAQLYSPVFGLAIFTMLNSVVLTTLVWRTAGTLNQTDGQRRRTEAQRNALNAALQQAHAFREKVLDSAVLVVIALNMEGRFTLVNRRMTEITGYSAEELIGQPFAALLPADNRSLVVERLEHTLQEGIPLIQAEMQLICKDGSLVSLVYGWSALFSEGKTVGMVGTGEDITERKRLEEQLFQARKMESVGRLAGGIAHDFNNLLTAILGYAELAGLKLEEGYLRKDDLEQIRKAADRAAALTNQLLAFARRQVIEPRIINLNALIRNLDTILQRLIGEHITLAVELAPDLHSVCVDPNQVEQILINLVVNARDAIALDGGKILVETANAPLDTEYARQHEGVLPGDYVLLAVSDTGSGIDEAVQLQIFEPFFTTKEKGRGTGLGLATVYGIVKQAGGHIWLYSEVGEGTTFKIYLPRATETAEVDAAPIPSEVSVRGTETVLVAEDEATVRALTTDALRGLGYHVLEAADGAAALRIHQEYAGDIALLLTDVVMPQMGGKELAERLLAARPTLKVLFVSGYTENTIMHHGVLEPGIAFLPKPFTPSALSLKVREVLNTA
jgi:PAS domain S-box-containing protein